MLLYKYAHKHGVENLRSLELKITRLDQFNDPFEFLPTAVLTTPARTIRKIANDKAVQRSMYEKIKLLGYKGSFKQYRSDFSKTRKENIRSASNNPAIPKKIRDNMLDSIKSNWGVLCLTADPASTLMWSHYADCHRGIVLGLDFNELPSDWTVKLHRVTYSGKRVEMSLKWMPGTIEHKNFINAMATTKNSAWKYEDEYRLLFKLGGLTTRPLSNGTTGFFTAFPAETIREVILGCRCTPETERDLRAALDSPHLKHVAVKRATIDETSFALVLKPA